MTMQPPAVVFADSELWATGYLRGFLTARGESYTDDVYVSNARPSEAENPYPARIIVVRRDGGPQDGLFDTARLTVRVWAPTEQECADLARMTRAAFMVARGVGPCTNVTSPTGPQGVPDERGPMKFFVAEATLRGADL